MNETTLLAVSLICLAACTQQVNHRHNVEWLTRARAADSAAIRALHDRFQRAHFERDAAAFVASFSDPWLDVRDGRVDTTSHASVQPGIQRYLNSNQFLEVANVGEQSFRFLKIGVWPG
jgi:hypothetical protein